MKCTFIILQSFKEFKMQVNTLASLQHPNLCKLIGFHAKEESSERMLVYELLHHGSLDRLLFGRPDGCFMDWATRLKVALGAAKGLAFLHDEGPFQVTVHKLCFTWSKCYCLSLPCSPALGLVELLIFISIFHRRCMMSSQLQTSK
jgi:serine/threonine protein kinase